MPANPPDTAARTPRSPAGGAHDIDRLSVTHARPSSVRIARARVAAWACALLWVLYMVTAIVVLSRGAALTDAWQLMGTSLFLIAVTCLAVSACMYLVARAGAIPRFAAHRRTTRAALDAAFVDADTRLQVLIPSYAEEPEIVRMALWSAALQEFPHLRVTLLLDDDPYANDPASVRRRTETVALVEDLARQLSAVHERTAATARSLRAALERGEIDARDATATAMHTHAAGAAWLRDLAAAQPAHTNVERFFATQVLGRLADDLAATADALARAVEEDSEPLDPARALELVQRVVHIFGARVTVFERKRYASLSHDTNKAANLNNYLGLLGRRYRAVNRAAGLMLEPLPADDTVSTVDLDVPDCDLVLTLDADSMLLPEYAARLVHELGKPGNERIGVIQTPYSAYHDAPTRLEMLAGATTDLQHIVHQGLTAFEATFWVGANAIIRRQALEDIRDEVVDDGIVHARFIRDNTVIEDTESSIELIDRGWRLYNYPERLSYSMTPSDFGALVVQRRRWANGGLLILSSLRRYIGARKRQGRPISLAERLLRTNYLASIATATFGLLIVLTFYPLDGQLVTTMLLLIAVPYFVEMASDLRRIGYRRRDVISVYGLNLLLISVNLAGTIASIVQWFTGRKTAFARTPKVDARTAVPVVHLLAPLAIIAVAGLVAWRAAMALDVGTLIFAAFTALCAASALVRLVGLRAAVADLWNAWVEWIWVEPRTAPAYEPAPRTWREILNEGLTEPIGATR